MTISVEEVDAVKRLLAEGGTSRCVARMTGVGRGSVLNIKHDKCMGRSRFNLISARNIEGLTKHVCPTCGWLGFMPCVACRAEDSDTRTLRMMRAKKEKLNDGDLSIRLVNGEREAYERLRAMKAAVRENLESEL